MPSFDSETYDRAMYQSARTKNGKLGPLPMAYWEAWDAAHAEEAERNARGACISSPQQEAAPLQHQDPEALL